MANSLSPCLVLMPAAHPDQLSPGQERIILGFDLVSLPASLNAPTGEELRGVQQLVASHRRWQEALLHLWRWQGCGFVLRFQACPEYGAVLVSLLARLTAQTGQAMPLAERLALELSALLEGLEIGFRALAEPAELFGRLAPWSRCGLVELRQREEVLRLRTGLAYAVHPLGPATGDFVEPIATLCRQDRPVALSLCLQPTRLTSQESNLLGVASSRLTSRSDLQLSDWPSPARITDPLAHALGKTYARWRLQLSHPFLVWAQVSSAYAASAWEVARSVAAAIQTDSKGLEPEHLQPALDVVSPQQPEELRAAEAMHGSLDWAPWGNSAAQRGQERWRYLSGSEGAAALFRLPLGLERGIPGVRTHQHRPDYDPGWALTDSGSARRIRLATTARGVPVSLDLDDLTRHGLVVGFTGMGKTNTCLYWLRQLWCEHRVPFLVVEPARTEYRGLLEQPGFEDLKVFTLGDETTSPFRLNPFELLPGVRLETHLGSLRDCFLAAMPRFGALDGLLRETLERIYGDLGWGLTDRGGQEDLPFPTLHDMYHTIQHVADERGWAGDTTADIRTAAASRLGALMRGSLGCMLDTRHSVPLRDLLAGPVVLELDALNDKDKAFVMLLLLANIREYRRVERAVCGLRHVLFLEEAHRVLAEPRRSVNLEIEDDVQGQAVQWVADMLVEMRGYGQAMLVADQSPAKLHRDALRNTDLKVAHALRDRDDRQAMATSMVMDAAQAEYLAGLPRGQAAVFVSGLKKATFVKVPPVKDEWSYQEQLPDDVVRQRMAGFRRKHCASYRAMGEIEG